MVSRQWEVDLCVLDGILGGREEVQGKIHHGVTKITITA
jgi:hypothetical protein